MPQKKNILIIDQNQKRAEALCDQLGTKRFNCERSQDEDDAIDQIHGSKPDLAILDMNTPRRGGLQFYKDVCAGKIVPPIPILVLTERPELEILFKNFAVQGFVTQTDNVGLITGEVEELLKPAPGRDELNTNKIVIVDHTPSNQILVGLFERNNYDPHSFLKGIDALIELYRNPDGVVLANLGLEDLAADEFALRLKYIKKCAHIPVFVHVHNNEKLDWHVIQGIGRKTAIQELIMYRKEYEIFEKVEQRIKEGRLGRKGLKGFFLDMMEQE